MIDLPRKPVTRFFVPLIDVLILLFCIFLLLPFVSKPDAERGVADGDPTSDDPATLRDKLQLAEASIKALMAERANTADRTAVVVLEIDADTGKLYTIQKDGVKPTRIEIANQADAQLVIDRNRQISGGKSTYFLIQYPRKLSSYPLQSQLDDYRRWFKDVPYGIDNPWSSVP